MGKVGDVGLWAFTFDPFQETIPEVSEAPVSEGITEGPCTLLICVW